MANLKSSKKDIRRTIKRTLMNKPFKRNADMLPRKVRKLVSTGETKEAEKLLPQAFKALDKAVKKNVLHKNNAARTKSRLTKLFAKAK
jgi:small subunit ribosomal protein S20